MAEIYLQTHFSVHFAEWLTLSQYVSHEINNLYCRQHFAHSQISTNATEYMDSQGCCPVPKSGTVGVATGSGRIFGVR